MVRLGPGLVVLLRFPFSDLSSSKLRPAIVSGPRWRCRLGAMPSHEQSLWGSWGSASQRHIVRIRWSQPRQLRKAWQAVHGE
jgi:hypothetical protein